MIKKKWRKRNKLRPSAGIELAEGFILIFPILVSPTFICYNKPIMKKNEGQSRQTKRLPGWRIT
jgi:hypothetical protein